MWHYRKLAASSKVLSVKRYTYYRSSGTPPIYTHTRKSILCAHASLIISAVVVERISTRDSSATAQFAMNEVAA